MKLQEFMVQQVVQAGADETVAAAAKRMHEKGVGCLVITLGGVIKGIITDRDLLDCLAQAHDSNTCCVSVHMRHPVVVLRPDESHVTAANVMRAKKIKRLPIANKGKLLGIISLSDLAWLANKEAEGLRAHLDFFTNVMRSQSARAADERGVDPVMPEQASKTVLHEGVPDNRSATGTRVSSLSRA